MDSHGLYPGTNTLEKEKDFLVRPTVSLLSDSFESKDISAMQWVARRQNIADALAKQNPLMFTILDNVCANRILAYRILARSDRVLSSSTVRRFRAYIIPSSLSILLFLIGENI